MTTSYSGWRWSEAYKLADEVLALAGIVRHPISDYDEHRGARTRIAERLYEALAERDGMIEEAESEANLDGIRKLEKIRRAVERVMSE